MGFILTHFRAPSDRADSTSRTQKGNVPCLVTGKWSLTPDSVPTIVVPFHVAPTASTHSNSVHQAAKACQIFLVPLRRRAREGMHSQTRFFWRWQICNISNTCHSQKHMASESLLNAWHFSSREKSNLGTKTFGARSALRFALLHYAKRTQRLKGLLIPWLFMKEARNTKHSSIQFYNFAAKSFPIQC